MDHNQISKLLVAGGVRKDIADDWAPYFEKHCGQWSKEDLCRLFANAVNETGHFTSFQENLNYSVQGLLNTFGRRFSPAEASVMGRKAGEPALNAARQAAIANHAYKNMLGNGDEASGDGWKFRGHGIIQLTGRLNFKLANAWVADYLGKRPGGCVVNWPDYENHPDQLLEKDHAILSTLSFWYRNGMDKTKDMWSNRSKVSGGSDIGYKNVVYPAYVAMTRAIV